LEKQVALRLEEKKQIVSEVAEMAQKAVSAVLVDYRGLSVSEMTGIRSRARDAGVYLRVVRNTLAKRAVEGTEFECLSSVLVGPSLLAFSSDEPGAAARLIRDCAKESEQLEVRAISMGGSLLGPESLENIASLPSLDEARASLLALIQAPITKLVTTINEVPGKLVRTVEAVKSGKGT
jgi:large subunit ribosomal protein L10